MISLGYITVVVGAGVGGGWVGTGGTGIKGDGIGVGIIVGVFGGGSFDGGDMTVGLRYRSEIVA